jgi:hypothetical protein
MGWWQAAQSGRSSETPTLPSRAMFAMVSLPILEERRTHLHTGIHAERAAVDHVIPRIGVMVRCSARPASSSSTAASLRACAGVRGIGSDGGT